MISASLALDVDVLVTLASETRRLSGSACGEEVGSGLCSPLSLDEAWSLSPAVTTANNACGIVWTGAFVGDTDAEVLDVGELVVEGSES